MKTLHRLPFIRSKGPKRHKNGKFKSASRFSRPQLIAVVSVVALLGGYFAYKSFAASLIQPPTGQNDLVFEYSLGDQSIGGDVPVIPIMPIRVYASGLAVCGNSSPAGSNKTAPYYSKMLTATAIQNLVQSVKNTGFMDLKQPANSGITSSHETISLNLKSGLYEYNYANLGVKPAAYQKVEQLVNDFCQSFTTPYQPSQVTVYTKQTTKVSQTTVGGTLDTKQNTDQVVSQTVSGAQTQAVINQNGRSRVSTTQKNGKTTITSTVITLPPVNKPVKPVNLSKASSNKVEAATTRPVQYVLFCSTDTCNQPRVSLDYYQKTSQKFYYNQTGKYYDTIPTTTIKGSHPASWYTQCHETDPTLCPKTQDPACKVSATGCSATTVKVDDPFVNTFNNIGEEFTMYKPNSTGNYTLVNMPVNAQQFILGFSTGIRNLCGNTMFSSTFGMSDFSDMGYGYWCTNTNSNFDLLSITHELGHSFGLQHTAGSVDATGKLNGGIMAYDDEFLHYFPDDSYIMYAQKIALQANSTYFHDPANTLYNQSQPLIAAVSSGEDNHQVAVTWYQNGWSGPDPIGGNLTSGVGTASSGRGDMHVFARGLSGSLVHKWLNNGQWVPSWEDLGGQITSAPAAASWSPGRYDVFARGTDGALYHKFYQNGWSGWESLGGGVIGGPVVTSWAPNRLDVFVHGTDNGLYHKWYDWSGWHGFEALGGTIIGDPTAVSPVPGVIYVFARGTDQRLYQKTYFNGWGGWVSPIAGTINSSPTVTMGNHGDVHVFALNNSNQLIHAWYDGGRWNGWENLGSKLTTAPKAVSWK